MKELADLTDKLLAEHRPDRYTKGGSDDGWLITVSDLIAPHIPPAKAQQVAAEQYVKNREGTKTQKANRYIREIYLTGQLPLDWWELGNLPLSVGDERVAIRAMSEEDWIQSGREEEERRDEDYQARTHTAESKFWFAGLHRKQGVRLAADLRIGESDAA